MIVDIHTHLWESPEQFGPASAERIRNIPCDPWDRPDASTTAYDRAMQVVGYSVVLGFVSQHLQASITPAQVATYVARMPGKYLGFAGLDPIADGCLAQLDAAVALGLVGVTISPAGQNFLPTHSRALKLLEHCQELHLPVLVQSDTHLGAAARLEFTQPYHWDEIAQTFPSLRIVLAQAGYPWVDQALVVLAKHPHVYADLSDLTGRPWQLYQALAAAHERGVTGKLLLGSDFPFCTPERAARNIYRAHTMPLGSSLPVVPREVLRGIVERDTLACLGIAPPVAPPQPPQDASTHAATATGGLE